MLCILCVSLRVYALPWHNTAPCHRRGGNGRVYLIIHELKTQTLVEVVEELLSGVKGFGGWVFLLYQNPGAGPGAAARGIAGGLRW